MNLILLVLLLVLLLGALPGVGLSHSYGYWPSSAAGTVLIVLLVLLLLGKL
jgi:hypothetical protein